MSGTMTALTAAGGTPSVVQTPGGGGMNPLVATIFSQNTDDNSVNAHPPIENVDDCGLRFLIALKQHEYLLRCLPIKQRAQLKSEWCLFCFSRFELFEYFLKYILTDAGLSPSTIIWALHSETTTELLACLSCMSRGAPVWSELRAVGAGWWIHNVQVLRMCIEKVSFVIFCIFLICGFIFTNVFTFHIYRLQRLHFKRTTIQWMQHCII